MSLILPSNILQPHCSSPVLTHPSQSPLHPQTHSSQWVLAMNRNCLLGVTRFSSSSFYRFEFQGFIFLLNTDIFLQNTFWSLKACSSWVWWNLPVGKAGPRDGLCFIGQSFKGTSIASEPGRPSPGRMSLPHNSQSNLTVKCSWTLGKWTNGTWDTWCCPG